MSLPQASYHLAGLSTFHSAGNPRLGREYNRQVLKLFLIALYFFVVLLVHIHAPEIVILPQDIPGCQHRRQHRMVLIVVFMHAIPTHQLQIGQAFDEVANDTHRIIITGIIYGVRLRHSNDSPILDINRLRESQRFQFSLAQRNEITIRHRPQSIAFEAEIFQGKARFGWIRHHLGTPILEVLDASEFDVRIMDVDPVIREEVGLVDNQCHGQKITVLQAVGGLDHGGRGRWIESLNQLSDRHATDKVGALDYFFALVRLDAHSGYSSAVPEYIHGLRVEADLAAALLDDFANALPHHSRPFSGIVKGVNQCLDDLAVLAA